MDVRSQGPAICQQCKKDIKTEIHKCVPCDKLFHLSCMKLHKKYEGTELIPYKGKTEVFTIKSSTNESDGAGEKDRERKTSSSEGGRVSGSTMDSKIEAYIRWWKR